MNVNKMHKGISPLIATIMLIAFTLIIAGILAGWAQQFAGTQQKKIEFCLEASVFLYSAKYDSVADSVDVVIYNNGNVPLAFVPLLSYEDTIDQIDMDNTLASCDPTCTTTAVDPGTEIQEGKVETYTISRITQTDFDNLVSITIQAPKCPGAQDFILKAAIKVV